MNSSNSLLLPLVLLIHLHLKDSLSKLLHQIHFYQALLMLLSDMPEALEARSNEGARVKSDEPARPKEGALVRDGARPKDSARLNSACSFSFEAALLTCIMPPIDTADSR